jgi:hypothetical protein
MEKILKNRGPSSKLGTVAKLLYVSQIGVAPPTIAAVVNDPSLFEGQYERYIMNRLREELPYCEVPIRLLFTKRQRKSLQELKSRQPEDTMKSLPRINPADGQASDGVNNQPDDIELTDEDAHVIE